MQRALADGATWLLGSLLGWGCVLALETVRHLHEAASIRGELAYLGRLASLQLVAFSTLPLALHGLRWLLDQPDSARAPSQPARASTASPPAPVAPDSLGVRITTWVVAALAVWPAWSQATFLTSGSAISEFAYGEELRLLLCGALVLGYAALWRWHVRGVAWRERESARRLGTRAALWYGAGLLALAALFYALSFQLKAYAFFAKFLVPPAWFVASTLGYRALRALPWSASVATSCTLALTAGVWTLGALVPEDMARARSTYMRRGKVAALSDLMVSASDTEFARLNTLPAERFECPPHPEARALPALRLPTELRRNVILISVDALRQDALRWKHRGQPIMPALRAFSQRSLRFERAVTTYPATLIAVGGALTGLNASQILFSPNVPDNVFKLTRERFDQQLISLPDNRWFKKKVVDKLFVQGARAELHADAAQQTAWLIDALKAARKKRERVLAWVHYYEPHQDYEKHEGLAFGDSARGRYKSELAYVDRQLGKLFGFLERGRYLDDTLVIVFADHGEAMGELDYEGHHVYLNSWITDIPLLVHAPGLMPASSSALADISDVAVTVLHFADVPVPWHASGISLLAHESARRGRVSFAEAFPIRGDRLFKLATRQIKDLGDYRKRMERIHRGAKNYLPKVSAVSADHRLIVNRVTGLEEFYDRRADRKERRDLSFQQTDAHRALRRRLGEWTAEQARLLYCRVLEQRGKPPKPAARPAPSAGAAQPPPPAPPAPAAAPNR
jgi:arylsulfatase A-like enzyme